MKDRRQSQSHTHAVKRWQPVAKPRALRALVFRPRSFKSRLPVSLDLNALRFRSTIAAAGYSLHVIIPAIEGARVRAEALLTPEFSGGCPLRHTARCPTPSSSVHEVLRRHQGNKTAAAREFGMHRTDL